MDLTFKVETRSGSLLKFLEADEVTKTRKCSGNSSNPQPCYFCSNSFFFLSFES